MSNRWMKVIGLLVLCAAPPVARGAEPLCPAGEGTLGPGALHAVRTRGGMGRVRSTHATFVLPTGVAIAPDSAPLVFVIEGDRQPIGKVTLDAGKLVSYRGGRRFAYRNGDSRLSLGHARGGYRLAADLGNVDLAALDLGHPQRFMKQILKIGDACFSSVFACTGKANGVVCKPERTVLLAGRVERSGHVPLPGTMVTLIDDQRLETVSVFAKEDGRYVFPPQRPGTYRVRARLIGYEDAVQADVVLAKDQATRVSFTMVPTANTNDQLPASA